MVEDAVVFTVVYRHFHQMNPRGVKTLLQQWDQLFGFLNTVTLSSITLGVFDKIRIPIIQPEFWKVHIGLFPLDHPVGIVP